MPDGTSSPSDVCTSSSTTVSPVTRGSRRRASRGVGAFLSDEVESDALGTKDRVFYLVATRQFEEALATIEALLASDQAPGNNALLSAKRV